MLSRLGFEYSFENFSRLEEGWEYWKCPRRPPYCPGRASVQIPWLVDENGSRYKMGRITAEHNHGAIFGQLAIRQANEQIREEAQRDFPTTSRNIVRNVRANLSVDAHVNAPSPVNMRNNYNIAKRRHQEEVGDVGLDVLPVENIVLPDALLNRVICNEIFNGHRMIVFCSASALEILRQNNTECAIDGTFESCPRGFAQLYTMSAIIDHCSVPCVYGLLPNKEGATYVRFFEAIRDSVGNNWATQRLMSDFESAAINSTRIVFANSTQSGCLFHFGQAIYCRIQRLPNLHTQYLQNVELQRNIRSLQALEFVPVDLVYNYFCILVSTLHPTAELQCWVLCKILKTSPSPNFSLIFTA